MEKKRVVILGGGFAGLLLCQELTRDFQVVLVDKNPFFTFTPMIVESVSGAIDVRNITADHRGTLGGRAEVITKPVRSVKLDERKVILEGQELTYDILVLALGSVVNFFGIPGAAEHSLPVRTAEDAKAMRARILAAFGDAAANRTFTIVGGGPTGVELALEVHELCHELRRNQDFRIVLVDGNQHVLGALEPYFGKEAERILRKRGVELALGRKVKEVTAEKVILDEGQIATTNVFWAAGMKASPIELVPAPEKDRAERIVVDEQFRIQGRTDAYAIGDIASFTDPASGKPLPMTAQIAEHEAKHLARLLAGKPATPFRFKEVAFIVSLGKFNAAVRLFGIRFAGIIGWLGWRSAYLFKLRGLGNRVRVARDWLLALFNPNRITRI